MIKLIEAPDIHADSEWIDHTVRVCEHIATVASNYGVDFIAMLGDFFNRQLFASDRSNYRTIIDLIKAMVKVCPVVAIEGTRAHDGPGAYAALEEVGLVLLRPGRVYGYAAGRVFEIKDVREPEFVEAVLFGIPELNKDTAEALGSDERSAEILDKLRAYVTDFIAPRRSMFSHVPAIGLLHGVVSDAHRDNDTDQIKRQSSLLIHTDDLARAGLDRWSLGDIHTPWESEHISAGYAGFTGIDANPYGKTGFVPAMNLVTIDRSIAANDHMFESDEHTNVRVERIPYGTPERRVITEPLSTYEPDVAYWLKSKTDDPELNPAKHGAHQWSRITFEVERKTTRRATKDDVKGVTKLSDIARLWSPDDITDTIAAKFDEIDTGTMTSGAAMSADLQSVRIVGCGVLFNNHDVAFNLGGLPREIIELAGSDNGTGKSSLVSFLTPYPGTIGKDTESGRASSIHEFFNQKESFIEKVFSVGEQTHRHLISIKGALTKQPSVECYLYVDGENVLSTKSFDEMMSRCESMYGPLDDHLLTAFNVQPEQSKNSKSIASSTTTELRERVLHITGIDRTAENEAANARVAGLERDCRDINVKILAMSHDVDEIEQLKHDKAEANEQKTAENDRLVEVQAGYDRAIAESERLAVLAQSSKEQERAKSENDLMILDLQRKNATDQKRIENARSEASMITAYRDQIAEYERASERITQLTKEAGEINRQNAERDNQYGKAMSEWRETVGALRIMENRIEALRITRDASLATASRIEEPCEKCGHVKASVAAEVASHRSNAHDSHLEMELLKHKVGNMVVGPEPVRPDVITFEHSGEYAILREFIDSVNIVSLRSSIETAGKAEALIAEIEKAIESRRAELADRGARTFKIDKEAAARYQNAKSEANAAAETLNVIRRRISDADARIARLDTLIEVSEKALRQTREFQDDLITTTKELDEWKFVAAAMKPSKIPAFELDLVLDEIDERATRYVRPFRSERYSFRSETQVVGKTGIVDRFQIVVHDGETGLEKSILKYSGGEKVFLADAYQKALLDVRCERRGVMHQPIVFDETDGAIRPERIQEYYQMQTDYFRDVRTIIISHAPDARNFIQNRVDIEELFV